MASINSTTGSAALPTAQTLFQQATHGGTGASAQTPTTASSPIDAYQNTDPTTLDTPDLTYPSLLRSHVAVLRAIGTPETVLQQLNAGQPQADYMDRYIQGEIMQNPEGWDDFVGNPRGTARAGLQKLVPGIQLPAAGQGTPGVTADGTAVDGPAKGENLVKGLVIAGVLASVGLLAWKFFKGRGSGGAKDAAEAAQQVMAGGDLAQLAGKFGGKGDDALKTLAAVGVLGGGGAAAGSTFNAHTLATLDSIIRGHGAANGFLNSVGASSVAFNLPFKEAAEFALADRMVGVWEQAARNGGTLADLAAAKAIAAQMGGAAGQAGSAASQLATLRAGLVSLINTL